MPLQKCNNIDTYVLHANIAGMEREAPKSEDETIAFELDGRVTRILPQEWLQYMSQEDSMPNVLHRQIDPVNMGLTQAIASVHAV